MLKQKMYNVKVDGREVIRTDLEFANALKEAFENGTPQKFVEIIEI